MKLDAILHALLPKDDSFFIYFEKDVENLLNGARVFRDLMRNGVTKEERAQKIRKIEDFEHKGDEITHQIFQALVPPLSLRSTGRISTNSPPRWMTSWITSRCRQPDHALSR